MTKKSRQKFKHLENEKSLEDEIKSIFHHYCRAIIEANKKKNLERETPILMSDTFNQKLKFGKRTNISQS